MVGFELTPQLAQLHFSLLPFTVVPGTAFCKQVVAGLEGLCDWRALWTGFDLSPQLSQLHVLVGVV